MKKLQSITIALAGIALMATAAKAQMSVYDKNAPIGWATVSATLTGGEDQNSVTVTTLDELKTAMSGTTKKTIYIKGEIKFTGSVAFQNVKNKTIYGLEGSALTNLVHSSYTNQTGIMTLKSCDNIILRNLTFKSAGAYDIDGSDNLTLQTCTNIWVDHCDFQDGVDGNFDCNNGSDNIAVTWCRFRYLIAPWPGGSGGSDDHRNCCLWGGSDSNIAKDGGKLNTTFANCWWDEGCHERMPRVRFGKVHIVNCLFSCENNNYCVGAGYKSNIYVENCAFVNVRKPWARYATSSGKTDYNITMTGNKGAKDEQSKSGSESYFVPSKQYTYEAYDVNLVENEVSTYAGATLRITEGAGVNTPIEAITTDKPSEVTLYDMSGRKVENTEKKGIYIAKTKNGETAKKMKM